MDGLVWRTETVIFAGIALVALAFLIVAMVSDAIHDINIPFLNDGHFGDATGDTTQWVNSQSALAFIAAYGATGWAVSGYGHLWAVWSALAGFGPGIVVGALATVIFNWFKKSETTTAFSLDDVVGSTGVITLPSTPGSVGKVTFRRGLEEHTAPAINNTEPLPVGIVVKITQAQGGSLVVERDS
jgi:hypothetical protein